MGIRLERDEYEFSNDLLSGLYTEFVGPDVAGLILNPRVAYDDREALEAEVECYRVRSPRAGRKFCYAPRSLEEMDRERIRALRRCIEEKRPDWVERVRFALRIEENDTYKIVAYSGVPPYPAVAILENMRMRGELPMVEE